MSEGVMEAKEVLAMRKHCFFRPPFCLLLSMAALGCQRNPAEEAVGRVEQAQQQLPAGCSPEGQCSVSFQIPFNTHLRDYGIVASHSVRLAPRAEIVQRDGQPAGAVSTGVGGVIIGNSAATGSLLSGRDVTLDGGTSVTGYVWARRELHRQAGVTISGDIHEGSQFGRAELTVVSDFTWPEVFQPAVHLEPGQTQGVSPGAFHEFTIKTSATLSLTGGSYVVRSLTLEPGGTLALDNSGSAVELHVLDWANCKGSWAPEVASANVRLVYWGTNAAVLECDLPGTSVIAPNAHVRIADRKHVGQLMAREAELGVEAVAEATMFHGLTTGPGDKKLVDLTPEEWQAACQVLEAVRGADGKETGCRLHAFGAVHTGKPANSEEARQMCSDAFEECMTGSACDEVPEFSAACEVTLGQRDACLEQWLPRFDAAFAGIPGCDDFMVYTAYTHRNGDPGPIPPECHEYFACFTNE